ncbi:MlotiK1 channel [Thalassovita autumnalis]|uniref:MlotiK1 channel n=1 Tax=Thalassovita autumnalis TaxID=2072972 RepID=A0A0P1F4U0_9RHOB|nr:ion transporter [Thalassovita autumnalis]CUH62805.1 MlotiK1 channel [Thalassovita autumnalis]CUH73539.1 MlotiK1 channel [Thalassovita autumnalis]
MRATDHGSGTAQQLRIRGLLNGRDARWGAAPILFLHGLILASAFAYALATVPNLPPAAYQALYAFERFAAFMFFIEYGLRFFAARHRLSYVFSFWGIIDLLAWLPFIILEMSGASVLRLLRLLLLARMLKLLGHSRAMDRLVLALRSVRQELTLFFCVAALLLYVGSVGIYLFEHEAQPEVFSSVPAALWWSVVTLTTVGYGDVVPITLGGRIFTSGLLLLGVGIFAVPAGVITSALISRDIEDIEETLEKIETSEQKTRNQKRAVAKGGKHKSN